MGHEPVWRSASVGRYRYQPDRISRRRPIGGRYSERQRFCRWRRCGGGEPHDGGGSHGGGPGGRAIMAEVLQCHVFARPDFRNERTAWRRRASRNPAAPRNAVSPSEAGAPRSAASRRRHRQICGSCHRTVLAYWKFESISLQQRDAMGRAARVAISSLTSIDGVPRCPSRTI